MDDREVILSPEESRTYLHLGVIAAHAGRGDTAHGVKQQIVRGERDPESGDLGAFFYDRGFNDEELAELYSFRNSLFHSMVFVKQDGSVNIHDRRKGERTYTAEEIRKYAGRFYHLRLEDRIKGTIEVYSRCKCGAKFQQPEQDEELEEHKKVCPDYLSFIDEKD